MSSGALSGPNVSTNADAASRASGAASEGEARRMARVPTAPDVMRRKLRDASAARERAQTQCPVQPPHEWQDAREVARHDVGESAAEQLALRDSPANGEGSMPEKRRGGVRRLVAARDARQHRRTPQPTTPSQFSRAEETR